MTVSWRSTPGECSGIPASVIMAAASAPGLGGSVDGVAICALSGGIGRRQVGRRPTGGIDESGRHAPAVRLLFRALLLDPRRLVLGRRGVLVGADFAHDRGVPAA